jgi:YD repeat-containing protein
MFVYCDKCKYDSGDRDGNASLAAKVNADGGHMEMAYDEHGKPKGWNIACPNGHDGDEIHLD